MIRQTVFDFSKTVCYTIQYVFDENLNIVKIEY